MTPPVPAQVPGPRSPWRSTWLHLGLLVVALALAWLSFERPFAEVAGGASTGAVVLQAAEGEVERLVHERDGRTLRIEAREDELGRWFMGRSSVDDEAADTVTDTVFVGGRQVEQMWRRLEPLRAVRVLEGVDEAKLEELGFADDDSAPERLSLTVRGREVSYRLGGSPFGGADRYARREPGPDGGDQAAGRVLVLPSELASNFGGGAGLLMERRPIASSRPDVRTMSLVRPGARSAEPLRIMQRVGANPNDTYWTLDGSEEADADIGAWVDKFFRLSVMAYRDVEPAADWRLEADVEVESREHGASTLSVWSAPEAEGRVWLARSPFTRLVVELSATLAEEVCADLDGLP